MNKVVVPNAILLGEVKSLLAEGKDVVIPTKGNSMLPFIRGGRDSVNLRRLEDVEVGDRRGLRHPQGRRQSPGC